MLEDNGKTARHRFEWWEDVRGLLDHVDDDLGRRVCGRNPTRLVLVCSALVDVAIRRFQTIVFSGSGSDDIGDGGVACVVKPVRAVSQDNGVHILSGS